MLTNKSLCEYINLYNYKGVALSCHVTLTSITGQACTGAIVEKWAVLTIRSASLVGNSKLSGVGILGIDHATSNTLRDRLDAYRLNKEKNSNKSINVITSSAVPLSTVNNEAVTVSTSKSKKRMTAGKTGAV
jgi:hypothetical protein